MEPTLEQKPSLESKLDLSHIFEFVLVPESFILKPKSTISSNHVLLLDQSIDHNDFEMIFQDRPYNQDNFNVRILHDSNHVGGWKNVNRKEVIKGEFLETPHFLDWAVTLSSIRPPLEPPP